MPQFRRDLLRSLEAGIVGLFLVQAVRYLYVTGYARVSSADLVGRTPNPDLIAHVAGVVKLATVQSELAIAGGLLLLPLLALLIARWRLSLPFAVILVALGRSMALQIPDLKVPATGLVVGGGLLYLALTIVRRPAYFPAVLLAGFSAEQLIRAAGDTFDHSWQTDYRIDVVGRFDVEMGAVISLAAIGMILLSIALWFLERREAQREGYAPPPRGVLNLWGGLALGGILSLEFTLLALPNVVARWSGTQYTGLVPWLLAATALPLVPEVRDIARRFAGMFDGAWRGWLWALLLGLLLVVGRRYEGIFAGVALVFAQFLVGLTLWWLIQTGQPRRNLTGIAVIFGVAGFGALAVADYFTYDYAYVRDLRDPYQNVGDVLRSFRGMGLGLALIAALIASIPMILARKRIPWRGGPTLHTLLILVVVLGASFGGAALATDTLVRRPLNPNCLRVGTLNIHGGYAQYFDPNLEKVAQLVELNGMDIVLLQEVEAGRMSSFGVDQVLWLARRLKMEAAFFPENETLQGIAVLSRVPILKMEGLRLPSQGNQAAVMHVTLDPDRIAGDLQTAGLGSLHIYNAWLGFREAGRNGLAVPEGEQDQNRQMASMLNWVAANHAPNWADRIILGGTFNFGPDSPLYRTLRMDQLENPAIKDPFAGLRAEETMTVYLVDGTTARFDYLWTFNLPLTGAMVDQSPEAAQASDHRSAIVAIGRREGVTCPP